jgi:peptidyl-prolyl cis-trans isomerase A (cyclophilin A)
MKRTIYFITLMCFLACGNPKYKNPHIRISTNYGDIEAELYPDKSPKTVSAFLRYIDSGIYTNSSFYRVLFSEGANTATNTGIIQGGTWPSNNGKYPFIKNIPHEPTSISGLSHIDGSLSLARTDTGTASTEFFICIGNQNEFDFGGSAPVDGQGFAAFGVVTEGMNIVREIQEKPKSGNDGFAEKIIIYKIARL